MAEHSGMQFTYAGGRTPPPTNSLATAGFVVSLIGLLFSIIPLVGVVAWFICPVGGVLAVVGLARASNLGGAGRKLAIAGVAFAILGLIVCTVYATSFANAVKSNPLPSTHPAAPTASYDPSTKLPLGSYGTGTAVETPPAPPTAPASTGGFSDGTYEVGTAAGDIPPGRYKTTGSNPDAAIKYCAVIREKTDGSIIDLQNSSGGPMVVTVKSSDGQVQFQGDCTWNKS